MDNLCGEGVFLGPIVGLVWRGRPFAKVRVWSLGLVCLASRTCANGLRYYVMITAKIKIRIPLFSLLSTMYFL